MKIAVLGGGISGLTAAHRLMEKGHDTVVYERDSRPGGLAKTRITDGYVYDPHGGHIFNSKHPEVVNWIFSILPKEKWQYTVRNAKIFFSGRYVSYPFELSLCELAPEDALNCAYDYLMAQQDAEPDNFRDWLVWNFGESIANYYMLPYNSKIWAYPLEKMETHWMQGKMPLPEKKELLRSLLLKDPSERKMPHSTFYYPIEGGIQTMVDAIAKPLNICTSCPVERVERDGCGWLVNGMKHYDHIISTIPLKVLTGVMSLPEHIVRAINGLKYNSLTTVLFKCPPTDISWLYIPSREYKAHRVGYQSALTPKATPDGQGSGALEIIGPHHMVDDKRVTNGTIIPKELQPSHVIDTEFTEYAYVIHDLDYRRNLSAVFDYFNSVTDFDLLGRWAQWNYRNMDLCMKAAMELAERIGEV
jgi:protoporphyrinogen oxidase